MRSGWELKYFKHMKNFEYVKPKNDSIQNKILWELFIERVDEEDGFEIEEFMLCSYKNLENQLGLPKKDIKPVMLALRNKGLVILSVGWNENEGHYSGSGWCLTEKGVDEGKRIFKNNNI